MSQIVVAIRRSYHAWALTAATPRGSLANGPKAPGDVVGGPPHHKLVYVCVLIRTHRVLAQSAHSPTGQTMPDHERYPASPIQDANVAEFCRNEAPRAARSSPQAQEKGACYADALNSLGGEARIRTGGEGFAGPCLTTWPLRHMKKADRDRPWCSHGAGYGVRTRDLHLGKVARYQLR